jgi:1-acyl-sn-glycerol-3-phosphate acyltransferase
VTRTGGGRAEDQRAEDQRAGSERTNGAGPQDSSLPPLLAFVRKRLAGDYTVDEFGFDPEFNDTLLLPLARALYEHWFDVRLDGLGNVPADGGALLVANHSGTLPIDAVMVQVGLRDHHPDRRNLRLLGADLVYQVPVLSHLARKGGHTLACQSDAARLLANGELVGVFPEGFKGVGKPYHERYQMQRFGRGGFVATALRAGVPIIPCAIVGAEEIYPKIADFKPLARLLGFPYFPITPTFPWLGPLGLVPLPSKWLIEFGTPIPTDSYEPGAADDHATVFELTDQVRDTVQEMVYDALERRGPAFG